MNLLRRAAPSVSSALRRLASSKLPPAPRPPHPAAPSSSHSKPTLTDLFPRTPRLSSPLSSHGGALLVSRRFYYVDRNQVIHFKRRGPRRWTSLSPTKMAIVLVVGSAGAVTIYYSNLETVPYTKRNHVVLLSTDVERQLGEAQFKQLKASLKSEILPPIHPDSIRVRIISKQIIDGLQRGLQHGDKVWSDMEYATGEAPGAGVGVYGDGSAKEAVWIFGEEGKSRSGGVKWSRKDEVLDDSWVQQSRKEAKDVGRMPATRHLEGLNWEVIVVRDPMVNAMCMPGGKIIVFTGLLEHFRTDAEIATIIGHEVGHAVARHVAEGITKNLWLVLLQLILLQFIAMPDLVNAMSTILLKFPFSRRMETEADYIGLLLMASAGYDPRIAPDVYKKLGKITGDSELRSYLSTHPSSKRRSELLSQAHVMEEALNIYREAVSGRGIEGFL